MDKGRFDPVSTFAERLRQAMEERDIKAIELSQKSGIEPSAISRYLGGEYKAKQENLFLLAQALDVSEAWLLGYDVPQTRLNPALQSPEDKRLQELTEYFQRLNPDYQEKTLELIKDFLRAQK